MYPSSYCKHTFLIFSRYKPAQHKNICMLSTYGLHLRGSLSARLSTTINALQNLSLISASACRWQLRLSNCKDHSDVKAEVHYLLKPRNKPYSHITCIQSMYFYQNKCSLSKSSSSSWPVRNLNLRCPYFKLHSPSLSPSLSFPSLSQSFLWLLYSCHNY